MEFSLGPTTIQRVVCKFPEALGDAFFQLSHCFDFAFDRRCAGFSRPMSSRIILEFGSQLKISPYY